MKKIVFILSICAAAIVLALFTVRADYPPVSQVQLGQNIWSSMFWGANSGLNNTTGTYNVGLGLDALEYNTTGGNNTALGVSALQANISGSYNLAIGGSALGTVTTGGSNVGIGPQALQLSTAGNNLAIGFNALGADTTGSQNLAIGNNAMNNITTGTGNIGIGYAVGSGTQNSSYNLLIGNSAGSYSLSGSYNIGIGEAALEGIGSSAENTAIGYLTMSSAGAGSPENTAVGYQALVNLAAGPYNTAVGAQDTQYSWYPFLTNNILIGWDAGWYLTNGSSNIYIGNFADTTNNFAPTTTVPSTAVTNESQTIRIGTPGMHLWSYLAGVLTASGGYATTNCWSIPAFTATGWTNTNRFDCILTLLPGSTNFHLFGATGSSFFMGTNSGTYTTPLHVGEYVTNPSTVIFVRQ